jgi:hypothetical protein
VIPETSDLQTVQSGIVATRLSDPVAPLEAVNAEAAKKGFQKITARGDVVYLTRNHWLEAFGHYCSDPRLSNAVAATTRVEWVEASIVQNSHERPALIATRWGRVAGFLMLRRNSWRKSRSCPTPCIPPLSESGCTRHMFPRTLQKGQARGWDG